MCIKRLLLSTAVLLAMVLSLKATPVLSEFLKRDEIKEINVLKGRSGFDEILEVMIEQPLDHNRPDGPSFEQRVYISHMDVDQPVVMITAGYGAEHYYTSEITMHLKCNQIMVEHRYFGKSTPDSINWLYLDTWQAASDHHRILTMFKEFYPEDWITTGISKGGQTVMLHSYYYPEDAKVRVPYVAPLNYGLEDERIYSFLEKVGPGKERRKIHRFQKMMLKNQDVYMDAFNELSEKNGYTYEMAGGPEKAFEYCVLEYSFAYWQWGFTGPRDIPGHHASPEEAIDHMNHVAGFDYFADESILNIQPFFYQAMTEMGYYGYDLDAFSKYLKHVENPIFTFTLPEDLEFEFDEDLSPKLQEYLDEHGDNFIYIYGEYDTWSATRVPGTGSTNSMIFMKESGSHRTRINNMPKEQRKEVYETLHLYLEESSE